MLATWLDYPGGDRFKGGSVSEWVNYRMWFWGVNKLADCGSGVGFYDLGLSADFIDHCQDGVFIGFTFGLL